MNAPNDNVTFSASPGAPRISTRVVLDKNGLPFVLLGVGPDTTDLLRLSDAEHGLLAMLDGVVQARVLQNMRSIHLSPEHEAVQQLLVLARLVVDADDAVSKADDDGVAGGEMDRVSESLVDAIHNMRCAFAAFDGEPIEDEETSDGEKGGGE